ncbi:esterase/lipase family protein [Luteimonas sp. A501]
MTAETTRRVGTSTNEQGIPVARSLTSPTQSTARAEVVVPPDVVVPILFVPGIMGSNLRNKDTQESVWNAGSVLKLALQWAFKSAKTRQTKLDPKTTEADPEGKIPEVAEYTGDDLTTQKLTEEQLRERGWGTVSNYGYGKFMAWFEPALNAGTSNPWESLVGKAPAEWGAESAPAPLDQPESEDAWGVLCPVYGAGYNWLQSNGKSAVDLAKRIDEIIAEWRDKEVGGSKPYRCDKVILVTHSMGGLVSRAAVHSSYGKAASKVLGINHGVMPADGAAASYHHVRSGYTGLSRFVLGKDGAQVTAIFANACGPLELLPNKLYGKGWLKAVSNGPGSTAELFALPEADPYLEIYVKREPWWRLIDPALIDPANRSSASKATGGVATDPWLDTYLPNLMVADEFHANTGNTFHAPTYSHYGADAARHSYQNIVWQTSQKVTLDKDELLGSASVNAKGWAALKLAFTLGKDNSDPARVAQGDGHIVFEIMAAAEAGDDTVPHNSGAGPFIRGSGNVRQSFKLEKMSEGHAASYDDENLRQITLHSIAKLIGEAE